MHLCLVSNEYPPAKHGGIGSCNHDLAEGLAAAGHRVTVVGVYLQRDEKSFSALDEKHHPNVRVVRIIEGGRRLPHKAYLLWNRWRLKRSLARLHRELKFDLLEASDYDGWLPWGGPKGLPTVVRLHGTNLFFDSELNCRRDIHAYELEIATLKSAYAWVGVSQYALDRTAELAGSKPRMTGVIYNAVDTNFFAPDPNVKTERGLIVFVNSINAKKGAAELMRAANLLLPKYPDAKLVMIGSDSGRKDAQGRTYIDQLKALLRPEIAGRVVFAGRLSRGGGVLDYLRKANVCCYPSHAETFGIAPVEAMSLEKPTVYSNCGPGPEVIEHGVSGLLCNPKSPEDIAAKLAEVLDDPDMARRFAVEGRKRVLRMFDRSNWIQRNVEFFERVVAGKF